MTSVAPGFDLDNVQRITAYRNRMDHAHGRIAEVCGYALPSQGDEALGAGRGRSDLPGVFPAAA